MKIKEKETLLERILLLLNYNRYFCMNTGSFLLESIWYDLRYLSNLHGITKKDVRAALDYLAGKGKIEKGFFTGTGHTGEIAYKIKESEKIK